MTILGRSEELVSRCIECDLAEPESLASLGGSSPGMVDGILSNICADFCTILDSIHDYSEFRATLRSALMFNTMSKIRLFTSWMGTKMTDGFLELYSEAFLALTKKLQ